MDCTRVQESLSDYSVGLIDGDDKAAVAEHLASCPRCKVEFVRLERVVFLLQGLERAEPTADLWNGVYRRIARRQPGSLLERLRRKLLPSHRRVVGWSVGLAAAAAVALVVIFLRVPANTPQDFAFADDGYVQGHVMFASQDYLADQVALQSVAALAARKQSAGEHP